MKTGQTGMCCGRCTDKVRRPFSFRGDNFAIIAQHDGVHLEIEAEGRKRLSLNTV
jgi:hypothetical protein